MPKGVREGYQTLTGHRWGLATHVEDLFPEEMARRQREFFASMAKK